MTTKLNIADARRLDVRAFAATRCGEPVALNGVGPDGAAAIAAADFLACVLLAIHDDAMQRTAAIVAGET
ncbi:MAG TPA: hypothetical protein VHX65_19830 [Pirellulales bacterium]|jgi:hypothetical protein|nr:hypothetical protein [Pirellulales bacterium]